MATTLAMKRMARERVTLEKSNPDYFVSFRDENLLQFEAYILGPSETLYEHKFVKVRFDIPQDYPLKPPNCTFIQHTGDRIHPNLHKEGKVCLSILGTWQGEPWALAMTCETVLITIRSLLDNSPYRHEPGQRDHPQFNHYVEYATWKCLLLDYLAREADPILKSKLEEYVRQHGSYMIRELEKQQHASGRSRTSALVSPYARGRTVAAANYAELLKDMQTMINTCQIRGNDAEESNNSDSCSRPTTVPTTNRFFNMDGGKTDNIVPTNGTSHQPSPLKLSSINTVVAHSSAATPKFSPAKPNARFYPIDAEPTETPTKKSRITIDLT